MLDSLWSFVIVGPPYAKSPSSWSFIKKWNYYSKHKQRQANKTQDMHDASELNIKPIKKIHH